MRTRTSVIGVGIAAAVCYVLLRTNTERQDAASSHVRSAPNADEARTRERSARPQPRVARSAEVLMGDTPVDLSSVIDRTRAAFHQRGEVLVGGADSYVTAVQARTLAFRPKLASTGLDAFPLELSTRSVGRETEQGWQAGLAYARDPDGHVIARANDDGAVEHLRNTPSGAEQTWTFDEPPAGDGDLVVRIATAGQPYVGRTRTGLHFLDPSTGLGTRYSDARWIDAAGKAHDLVSSYEDGEIVLRVPANVIVSAAYPAVLDPTISAEFGMDNPVYGPAPEVQVSAQIGHSGWPNHDFLVVWHDRRQALGASATDEFDVYAAHVASNGTVLDPVGILITPEEAGTHRYPRVVWSGPDQRYVILYVTVDSMSTLGQLRLRSLVTPQGTNPTTQITLFTCPFSCTSGSQAPDLAFNIYAGDDRFMATWMQGNDIKRLTFQLDAGGNLVNLSSAATVVAGTGYGYPRVAGSSGSTGASNFLITFESSGGGVLTHPVIAGGVYDKFNNVVAPTMTIVSEPQKGVYGYGNRAGFTRTANRWVVAGAYLAADFNIKARLLSTTGVLGNEVYVNTNSGQQYDPSVIGLGRHPGSSGSDDSQVLIAWTNAVGAINEVRARRLRVSNAGLLFPQDTMDGLLIGGNASSAGVISGHSNDYDKYVLAWSDKRNDSFFDIYGSRVSYAGAVQDVLGGFLISKSSNRQTAPAIRECGSRYLVAWSDTRNGFANADIYGTLLDATGVPVIQGIAITTASGRQDLPAIACDGTNFYVVWVDERSGNKDIYGNGINATTGARLLTTDATIVNTSSAEDHPAIAYGAGRYQVVWDHGGDSVRTVPVSATSGTPTATAQIVSERPDAYPDIDSDGSQFLVVAMRGSGTNRDLVGTFISSTNTVGSTFAIETKTSDQRYPSVRFDRQEHFYVAYEDDRFHHLTGVDIWARRVHVTGAGGVDFPLAESAGHDQGPKLAARRREVLELTYWRAAIGATFDHGVWGQTISTGAVFGAPFVISDGSGRREVTPAIACISGTSCVAPYRWFHPQDTTTNADRIKARVLTY